MHVPQRLGLVGDTPSPHQKNIPSWCKSTGGLGLSMSAEAEAQSFSDSVAIDGVEGQSFLRHVYNNGSAGVVIVGKHWLELGY